MDPNMLKTPTRAVNYEKNVYTSVESENRRLRISQYNSAAQNIYNSRYERKLSPEAIEKKRHQIQAYKGERKQEWQGIGSGVKIRTEEEYKAELAKRKAERPQMPRFTSPKSPSRSPNRSRPGS